MNKTELKQLILKIANETECLEGRYQLAHFGAMLRRNGFDYRDYGFYKLSQFFELLDPFIKLQRDTSKVPPVVYLVIDEEKEIPENISNILENEYNPLPYEKHIYNGYLDAIKEDNSSFRFVQYFGLVLGIVTFISSFILITADSNKYFSERVKSDIEVAIRNGADLMVIKHIFASKELKNKSFIRDQFIHDKDYTYLSTTSLGTLLEDIKSDCYTVEGKNDSVFLLKLNNMLKENEELDPFDNLESNQKFIFQNIRQKLDSNYNVIKEDFNRVTEDAKSKNILLTKYLAKSDQSYWLSIIALVFSVIVSVFQIFQSRSSTKKINEVHNRLIQNQDLDI